MRIEKQGHSDLITSFFAPTCVLEELYITVKLRLKLTASSVIAFYGKLPQVLDAFSTKMTDKRHVTVLPYRPTLVLIRSRLLVPP